MNSGISPDVSPAHSGGRRPSANVTVSRTARAGRKPIWRAFLPRLGEDGLPVPGAGREVVRLPGLLTEEEALAEASALFRQRFERTSRTGAPLIEAAHRLASAHREALALAWMDAAADLTPAQLRLALRLVAAIPASER
jgi:hypothetical protein